jgi:3-oxoacyl-[acyl-carrier-protein] synthase II
MVKRAVILGYDAVSPLGTDMKTQWENAAGGKSGIGPLTRFPLTDEFPVRIAGEVAEWDASPYPFLSPRNPVPMDFPCF